LKKIGAKGADEKKKVAPGGPSREQR